MKTPTISQLKRCMHTAGEWRALFAQAETVRRKGSPQRRPVRNSAAELEALLVEVRASIRRIKVADLQRRMARLE